MRNILVVVALTALGCGGKGDECQQFMDKSTPIIEGMLGKKATDAEKKKLLDECRTPRSGKRDPVIDCVVKASGEAAVRDCYGDAFKSYQNASKKTEAQLMLNRLGKNAKVAFITNATFPVGKAGPTPAEDCCKGEGGKCAVTQGWSSDPVWSALEFQIDEPHLFRYSYESDGKTVTATAIGDLDCDGTPITYRLEMTAGQDGNPTMNIVPPAPNTD